MATADDRATALLDALASLVERALARLIALDPGAPPTVAALEGRSIRLRLRGAPRGLRLRIAEGRVRPVPDGDDEADLALAIAPDALLAWLSRPDAQRGLPSGLRIDGEVELARLIERALADYDPDWSQPFVALFGSTVGPQLARALGGALAWTRRQGSEFAASAAEYATEETGLVAGRVELDELNGAIDRLRDDVERLAARLARVERGGGRG